MFKYWILKKFANLIMLLGISKFFHIKRKDFVLRFFPSHFSKVLWLKQYNNNDRRFDADEQFLRTYLKLGDVVIDAGANIGFLTMICSVTVGRSGKVYAFEPHPICFGYLCKNIELNNIENICAHSYALGAENKIAHFTLNQRKDDHNHINQEQEGTEVVMRRLDSVDINENAIALLKIDVEGYEKFVIEGTGKLLDRIQCIYFETTEYTTARYNHTPNDVRRIIEKAGFSILDNTNQKAPISNFIAIRDIQDFKDRTQIL